MATGGNSGQVSDATTPEIKARWGPFAYLRGAAEALSELTTYHVRIALDQHEPVDLEALNLIVANGRTAAGGFDLAPRAHPGDGWLECILLLRGSFAEQLATAARYLASDYLDSPQVVYRRARHIHIESTPPLPFSIDGDLHEGNP